MGAAAGKPARARHWLLFAVSGAVAGAAAAAAVLLVAGGDAADAPERLSPDELPSSTVAVVTHVAPQLGTVTKREFAHSLDQAAAQSDLEEPPGRGDPQYGELKKAALATLLDSIWVRGQAEEMGIFVTDREVADEFAKIREESFESKAEYQEFLRESRYTDEDVDERVLTQLLTTKVQEEIVADLSSEKAKQEAFQRFVRRYNRRWRSRTVCAPAFATERCSNGERISPP